MAKVYKFKEARAERWIEKFGLIRDDGIWFITPTEDLFEQAVVGVLHYNSVDQFTEETGVEFLDIQDFAWQIIGIPARVFTMEIPDSN